MRNFIIVLILLFIITASVISFHNVVSPSMEDTLLEGDAFIVLNFWYSFRLPFIDRVIIKGFEPAVNDLLIFKYPVDPAQIHVKRCVAVGGQTVQIVEKKLFVDDVEIPLPPKGKHDDPEIIPEGLYGSGKRDFIPKVVIPDTAIYVMGDNRDFSVDSRIWGVLSKENIRGKVWFVLLSLDPDVSWFDFTRKVRWKRMFKRIE